MLQCGKPTPDFLYETCLQRMSVVILIILDWIFALMDKYPDSQQACPLEGISHCITIIVSLSLYHYHCITIIVSSHLISSHLISSHLISSHLISSHLVSSRPVPSFLVSSHLILSYLPCFKFNETNVYCIPGAR